ncbi:hypothetical protein LUZ60_015030 [Juncus effusus]|nr:hypothetical protein LUZ60_015030 [Juncus effusus]
MPFVAWHERKGCVRPTRWVLYQKGEIRNNPAQWVKSLVELTFRDEMKIEKMVENPSCFEEAVVFRHNEGKMAKERKVEVYEMVRCKAREFCKIRVREEKDDVKLVRVTLLLRNGSRSFKDEAGVIRVFEKECKKVKECRLEVVRSETLAYCDQVELMSKTDVVASPHGAQLTNLVFMNKNSSVMEFFPKGWKELAGVGQFVFRWISAYSAMCHVGTWYDPKGDKCPYNENGKCMSFYKNRQIGHDEKFLSNWLARVLKEEKGRKLRKMGELKREKEMIQMKCKCG